MVSWQGVVQSSSEWEQGEDGWAGGQMGGTTHGPCPSDSTSILCRRNEEAASVGFYIFRIYDLHFKFKEATKK